MLQNLLWCFDVNYCECIRSFYQFDANCCKYMNLMSITANASGSSTNLMSITVHASGSFYQIDVNYCKCIKIFLWNWCQSLWMHQDLVCMWCHYCKCIRIFYEFDVNFCKCGRVLYEIWFYVIVLKNFCVLNIPRIVISWITQNASGSWMNFDVM